MAAEDAASTAKAAKKKKSAATLLVEGILEAHDEGKVELWHTVNNESYISIKCPDGHVEHRLLSVNSNTVKTWLAGLYYDQMGVVPSASVLRDALTVLEGNALKGPQYNTYIRVAGLGDTIYLDLCDDKWQAVEITKVGWKVIKNPPVKFRRPSGMLPLPVPEHGGSLDDLKGVLNAKPEENWLLMKGWAFGLLRPAGPYPSLSLTGEQDSAKTYDQKILRNLVDPNDLPIRRPPKDTEDLMIAANNGWILSFDNMSKISVDMSDDLCTVATGGGLSKRKLYTDTDETIMRVCRPIAFNGIEDIATRPDLLDRAICVVLPKIPKNERRAEEALLREFDEKHGKILGAMLDAAVIGMQRFDAVKLEDAGRMAGFLRWAVACLGDEGEAFLEAYHNSRTNILKDVSEGDDLVRAVKTFAETEAKCKTSAGWVGSATDLLTRLPGPGLPKQANALSGALRRKASVLRNEGIYVEAAPRTKSKVKQMKITTISGT